MMLFVLLFTANIGINKMSMERLPGEISAYVHTLVPSIRRVCVCGGVGMCVCVCVCVCVWMQSLFKAVLGLF